MDINNNNSVVQSYILDYIGKYHFYEEADFVENVKDGQYILDNLKEGNRFDYNKASYTFTKFGNISEGITENNVTLGIEKDSVNVRINGEITHLDLIYKMEVKTLEDHYRLATRISEKGRNVSALLYINIKDGESCLRALEEVKQYQEKLRDS